MTEPAPCKHAVLAWSSPIAAEAPGHDFESRAKPCVLLALCGNLLGNSGPHSVFKFRVPAPRCCVWFVSLGKKEYSFGDTMG
jgi:hypothetical protein